MTWRPRAEGISSRPFAKDSNFMRISRSQCALVLILTTAVSGCYSGGKWSMPNLAFWKTNPFSSSDPATASTYPPPTNGTANGPAKPSALAANNSGAATTAPPYQNPAAGAYPGSAAAPQYAYPGSATTAAATRTPNYPGATPSYSPTSPAYTASATNSVTNSSLTPQQGLYGSTGYTDSIAARQQAPFAPAGTAPAIPGNSANSYPSTTANNGYPSSNLPGAGYPNSGYSNPVRPPIPPATNQAARLSIVTIPQAPTATAVPRTAAAAPIGMVQAAIVMAQAWIGIRRPEMLRPAALQQRPHPPRVTATA